MRDVTAISDLLKVCWHSTYDPIIGPSQAVQLGSRVYSRINLGLVIARSLASRELTVLAAMQDCLPVGYAAARRDDAEIVLYGLYVHPERKAQGIGSALLDAVIARHPAAKAVRLEVLKDNYAAVSWYQAKGFEIYGHTASATGTTNVPALYMDKRL